SLDPTQASDQASGRVITAIYEGLMRWDADGTAIPGVAEDFPEVSSDGRTYAFRLRPNALWSNGEPVTSYDFLQSWERLLNPATAADYVSLLHIVKNAKAYSEGSLTDFSQVGLQAPDPHTFIVTLESP